MSSAAAFDADDWAKEDCACGHPRYAHGHTGKCSRAVTRREKPDLPEPVFADGVDVDDDPFAWPENWPLLSTWPLVEGPCGCTRFDYPEPEPGWGEQ